MLGKYLIIFAKINIGAYAAYEIYILVLLYSWVFREMYMWYAVTFCLKCAI